MFLQILCAALKVAGEWLCTVGVARGGAILRQKARIDVLITKQDLAKPPSSKGFGIRHFIKEFECSWE